MLERLRKAMEEFKRILAGNPVAEVQGDLHEAVHATLADLYFHVSKLDDRVTKLEHVPPASPQPEHLPPEPIDPDSPLGKEYMAKLIASQAHLGDPHEG